MKIAHALPGLLLCALQPIFLHAQWSLIPCEVPDSLTAVVYDHGRFLTTGGDGAVLSSNDDGLSFSASGTYTPHFYYGGFNHLAFFDSLNGVGSVTLAGDALQRTEDGGATWASWTLGPGAQPWVQPINDSDAVLFLAGPGLTFGTDGRFLIEQDFEIYANIDSICNEIYTPGSCTEWIVDEDTLIQTGSWGWTRSSSDRCSTFDTASFNYGFYVYVSEHIAGDTLAYIDFNRTLRISHDGGMHWQPPQDVANIASPFFDIDFDMLNARTGIVVGADGGIWHTDDAGTSWLPITPLTDQWLRDVHFVDALRVFAVGDGGTILRSIDGGFTWQTENSGTTADLKSIASSPGTVVVVGDNATILRRDMSVGSATTSGGSTLAHAWPNPFRNEVTIEFNERPPSPTFIILADALGRTVLIHPSSGGERVVIPTDQLPAGLYVCRWTMPDGTIGELPLVRY